MLAPIIAVQLLAASSQPPPPKLVAMLLAVAAGTSVLALAVATLTLTIPGAYTLGVGVLYLWGFTLALTPRLRLVGTLMITMTVVVTAIAAASSAAAGVLVVELGVSVSGGLALALVAHALFPHPLSPEPQASAPSTENGGGFSPVSRAVLATAVILPLHLYLTSDGVAAMVILMTTSAMLRQPGLAQSHRYVLVSAIGNGLGGLLALISAFVFALHGEILMLAALTAVTCLFLAGRLVDKADAAGIYLPCFIAYIVLFGLTLSPLPLGDEVPVFTRVAQITIAAVYTLAAVSLLLPVLYRLERPLTQPAV